MTGNQAPGRQNVCQGILHCSNAAWNLPNLAMLWEAQTQQAGNATEQQTV